MLRWLSALVPRRRGRVRFQVQCTIAECGAACLAMILSYYGVHTTVRDLRERLAIGRDGLSALTLAKEARRLGFEARGYRTELTGLAQLRLPAIAHLRDGHFVVVESYTPRKVTVVDPTIDRLVLNHDEFEHDFSGTVVEFVPTERIRPMPRKRSSVLSFLGSFLPHTPGVAAVVLLATVLLTALAVLPAATIRYIVDTVLVRGDHAVLTVLGLGIAAFTAGNALITFARAELLLYLGNRVDAAMMQRFLRHLLSLPYAFFQLRTGGDLLNRVASNAILRQLITSQLVSVFLDSGLVMVYLVVLTTISPWYGLTVGLVAVLELLMMAAYTRRVQALTHRSLAASAAAQSYLMEALVGIETVKVSGAEDKVFRHWRRLFGRQLQAFTRRGTLDNVIETSVTIFQFGVPLGLLWLGAYQVLRGELALGTMLALNSVGGSVLNPLMSLANSVKQLQTVGVYLARLQDIMSEPSEQKETEKRRPIELSGGVQLSNVSFSYGVDSPPAIQHVTLTIESGQKVAIVGRTGSGKSTLSRLIMGLYRPTEGVIAFDGVPLDEIDLRSLRQQCGAVAQDAHVFSGSIAENLTLYRPDATHSEIVEAARLAEFHQDVEAMPMKYQTILVEGGVGLSGGQRQRLALARALVGRPRILLLDEASSHLDASTEERISQNLKTLDCTRLMIAHRLSTVRDANLILVVQDGRIVECGTHDGLVSQDGIYTALVAAQLSAAEIGT
jgi:ABC-type bacteriocin/lantibiotic exporter with double-glycine peptidase domain